MSDASGYHDEIVGGECTPPQTARKAPVRGSGSGQASNSTAQPGAPEDEEEELEPTCIVCEAPGQLSHKYRGKQIHHVCMNAVRAFQRLAGKSETLRRQADKDFWADIPGWRKRILPLVTGDGERRSPRARMLAEGAMQVDDNVTGRTDEKSFLRLPLQPYISWRMFWYRCSEDEAEAEFVQRLEDQGTDAENSGDEPTIMVRRFDTQRHFKGSTATTRMIHRDADADDSGGPTTDRATSPASRSICPPPRNAFGADITFTPSEKRAASVISGDGADDIADNIISNSSSMLPRRKYHKKSPPESGPTSATKRAAIKGKVDKSSEQNKHVQHLRMKGELAKDVRKALIDYGGPKSTHAQLAKQIATTDVAQLNLLDANAPNVLKDLFDKVVQRIQDIEKCLDNLPLKDVPAKRADFDSIIADAATYASPAADLVRGIMCMLDTVKNESKKEELQKKYQVDKFIRNFVSGGAPKNLAKRVGYHWLSHLLSQDEPEQPNFLKTNMQSIDVGNVTVFKACVAEDDENEAKLVQTIRKMHKDLGASMTDKQSSIAKSMNKNNFKTAMSKFEICVSTPARAGITDDDSTFMTEVGASLWLGGIRNMIYRYDPKDFPLPGYGCAITAINSDLVIAAFSSEDLNNQAITIGNLSSFLATDAGDSFINDSGAILTLQAGSTTWIPFGFVPVVMYPEAKSEDTDNPMPPIAFYSILTGFYTSLAGAIPETTWKGIVTTNTKHCETMKGNRTWASRVDLVKRFNAAVAEAHKQ